MTSLQLSLIFLLTFPLVLSFVSINRDHPEVGWAWLQCLTNTSVDALFIRVAQSVQVKRCVGVSAESSISLLCRGLPASAMWTELKCRHCYSVSCSHARPCQMVLAAGMPDVGFISIVRARPTEQKGTIRFISFCCYCCSDSVQVVVMLFRLYSIGFICLTCHLIYDNCVINTPATWLRRWRWKVKVARAVWLISWPGMSELLVLLLYIK